jgi:hypothetical protein
MESDMSTVRPVHFQESKVEMAPLSADRGLRIDPAVMHAPLDVGPMSDHPIQENEADAGADETAIGWAGGRGGF